MVIPLGVATITKDIMSLKQVEEVEAEKIKLKYGDAYPDYNQPEGDSKQHFYTTSDGRNIEIVELQKIIEARTREIVSNVFGQIRRSGLADKLLSGIILAGGGSNMKNITKLFEEMYKETIKQEQVKVRVANKLLVPLTKASGVSLQLDNNITFSLLSVLAQGKKSCAGESQDNTLFDKAAADEAAAKRAKELEQETAAVEKLKVANEEIRKMVDKLNEANRQLKKDLKNKKFYKIAQELFNTVELPAECQNNLSVLDGKDKYKTQRKETEDLIEVFHRAEDVLSDTLAEAKKAGSFWKKIQSMAKEVLNDDN